MVKLVRRGDERDGGDKDCGGGRNGHDIVAREDAKCRGTPYVS